MRQFHALDSGGAAQVIAFRAEPGRIRVAGNAPGGTQQLTASQWRQRTGALVAVNGGFFDAQGRSLGVRIADGRRLARRHEADWGVFVIRNGKASIIHTRDFKSRVGVTEAVQCGPRLVVNGRLVKLKEQWARRTALGVQRDGRVIVAIADGAISFKDWATIWQSKDGFNCPNALSLDGGGSTQLSVKTRRVTMEISGNTSVPDAIIIR
jgi:uncharacterized protein YigE (DUF2233 family)